VITNVVIHLHNEMPIVVDVEQLPSGADLVVHATNVRTIDGKRPSFVTDRHATFVFPLSTIRLIEAPSQTEHDAEPSGPRTPEVVPLPPPVADEEPDEDLLARIRQV
jgi:hypothetical protein